MEQVRERVWGMTVALCLLSLCASGALAGLTPASAYGSTFYSCSNPHCYDLGAANNNYAGIEGDWHNNALTMPSGEVDNGYHMSNEMWLYMGDGQWVETGTARGCGLGPAPPGNNQTCTQRGGNDRYMQFWGDSSASGTVYFHLVSITSADGTNHTHEIWDNSNCGNNAYHIYLDFNQVGTSTIQPSCHGTGLNAGMELYSPGINGNESSGTFNNFIQVYINSEGAWRNVTFDANTYHDMPCGTDANCAMDQCSEFANCLYWSRNSDYEWTDSKP